jgi:hypothetical protein
MKSTTTRSSQDERRISTKNEFELCYLRHKYLRKRKTNPTDKELSLYSFIVKNIVKNTYSTYKNLFKSVGIEFEDLISIGQVHLVSFLGVFALEQCPEKLAAFIALFTEQNSKEPDELDLLSKNKANFTIFLKQRMEDVVRVCRQKVRCIKGTASDDYLYFCGTKKPPRNIKHFLENSSKHGYKKIDSGTFRSAKKHAKDLMDDDYFIINEKYYLRIPVETKNLDLEDFAGANLNPYDNIHNMTPEKFLDTMQENRSWNIKLERFNRSSVEKQVQSLKDFIERNNGLSVFKDEIRTAKQLIKDMGSTKCPLRI